ncbi:MAG TPA: chemotaxis protein CheA [Steroidobacteraceae bacterium]|nr:chemotaxis protein CheA [Steroidobacteraceae bacterium]
MTVDLEMAEIAKVFFQESREGLDVMESGLLSLGATADSENINTIFRAAHSIKGGSATFGFAEVAGFTHGVETLLDEMRNGVRPVTAEAIQTLLQACDCLREMIAATEAEQPLDQVRIASLNGDIKHILGEANEAPAPASVPAPAAANEAAVTGAASEPSGWHVRFEPVADLLRLRNEPTRMFAELRRLGAMVAHADASRLPPLDALDPESCYLSWSIDLTGQIPRGKLDEIFDWVDSGCRLEFTPTGGPAPAAPAPGAKASAQPQAAAIDGWSAATKAASPTEAKAAAPADADRSAPAGAPVQKASGDSGSIRVATEKVDNIINLVGELLITQSMLSSFADGIDPNDLDRLRQGLSQLARNTRELQESVMQIRMLPISFAFNRFPRIVHDLSRKLAKKVELKLSGEGTELDKTVLEKISDPLVHLVRNALDHGLETPERRVAAGKHETGTLELAAFHEGGNIIIEVRDDGAGLNKAKILQKARERALVAPDQELTDEQIDNLIFMPGFSTAEQISDVSGRGVGMDVVRRNINDLGGHVQISSKEGLGSTIRIRLPLTLAILDGQLVRVGKEIYVISLLAIVETIQVARERVNTLVGRTEVFRLRDEYLPVVKLCDQFGVEPDSRSAEDGLLVVLEADGKRVGVLVDDLLAQQQVVIKSLESNFKSVAGIAGATILGDGTVALIIDAPGLISSAAKQGVGAVAAHAA